MPDPYAMIELLLFRFLHYMSTLTDIQGTTQTELFMLGIVGMLNRQGMTARNLRHELLPSNGYGLDVIVTTLNSLVTKGLLTLPVPYGTASGPADTYAAVYRVTAKAGSIAEGYGLAELIRSGV